MASSTNHGSSTSFREHVTRLALAYSILPTHFTQQRCEHYVSVIRRVFRLLRVMPTGHEFLLFLEVFSVFFLSPATNSGTRLLSCGVLVRSNQSPNDDNFYFLLAAVFYFFVTLPSSHH